MDAKQTDPFYPATPAWRRNIRDRLLRIEPSLRRGTTAEELTALIFPETKETKPCGKNARKPPRRKLPD